MKHYDDKPIVGTVLVAHAPLYDWQRVIVVTGTTVDDLIDVHDRYVHKGREYVGHKMRLWTWSKMCSGSFWTNEVSVTIIVPETHDE
jgi:hypothetical protein